MYVSIFLSIYLHRQAAKTFGACGRREKHPLDRGHGASIVFARGRSPMRICSQPRRHPRRNSIQIHGLELMSLSVLYGFRELRVVLGTRILHAAAVCSVHGSLSPLQCSMPIVQIASKALHDANDALLGVHCITRITRPHFHCFSDPRFGALSPTKLRVHPLKLHLLAPLPSTPP